MIPRSSKSCWRTFRSADSASRKTSPVWPISWLPMNPTTSREQHSSSTAVCCGTIRSNNQRIPRRGAALLRPSSARSLGLVEFRFDEYPKQYDRDSNRISESEVEDGIEKWTHAPPNQNGDSGCRRNPRHARESADETRGRGRLAAARSGNSIQRHQRTASARHGHADRSAETHPTSGGVQRRGVDPARP